MCVLLCLLPIFYNQLLSLGGFSDEHASSVLPTEMEGPHSSGSIGSGKLSSTFVLCCRVCLTIPPNVSFKHQSLITKKPFIKLFFLEETGSVGYPHMSL